MAALVLPAMRSKAPCGAPSLPAPPLALEHHPSLLGARRGGRHLQDQNPEIAHPRRRKREAHPRHRKESGSARQPLRQPLGFSRHLEAGEKGQEE